MLPEPGRSHGPFAGHGADDAPGVCFGWMVFWVPSMGRVVGICADP